MGRFNECLLFLLARPLLGQLLQTTVFPDDRSHCDSSDPACSIGTYEMAARFPVRTQGVVQVSGFEGDTGILNPLVDAQWVPAEGTKIDYTNPLPWPDEPYKTPTTYENNQGYTAFVGKVAVIVVNDTHFFPQNVSVLPGSTVTWQLDTYETVNVRSDDDGVSFNSGPFNRNRSPNFVVTFNDERTYTYHNAETAAWRNTFKGNIIVENYNCSSYTSCMTCLAYNECLWCPGNGTCFERNVTTNFPIDEGVVAKIAYIEDRDYQSIRYMEGYNLKTASFETDWFPWPPIRKNPRAVPSSLVPAYLDPTSSDSCYAYMRTRDATQCSDYSDPPPLNRVQGVETPNRPELTQFFSCYEHLSHTWTMPDIMPPVAWTAWPAPPSSPAASQGYTVASGDAHCCELCSICNASVLIACNISCGTAVAPSESDTGICPLGAEHMRPVFLMCANYTHNASSACARSSGNDPPRCDLLLRHTVSGALPRVDDRDLSGRWRRLRSNPEYAAVAGKSGKASQAEGILDTEYRPLGEPGTSALLPQGASAPVAVPVGHRSRRMQAGFGFDEEEQVLSAWEQIPSSQRVLVGQTAEGADLWAILARELRSRYGHRCNTTVGCDDLRGTCLDNTGHPIYAYDQNGTCVCHPWFTGSQCTELLINEQTCVGMPDFHECKSIREKLFLCGDVKVEDALPDICLREGMTIVQCGEGGHMKGNRSRAGVPNFIGSPEAGYAAVTCSKCLARGEVRSETYAKTCDRSVTLRACQRHEDAFAQRICNYCASDTQGSVLPQKGERRSCSLYRGTCMGSVEKRIRGIVPPNQDIVGQTAYGGLRYCKKPSTFTSTQHYYTDQDIMQVGQTCLEGTTPTFEGWDFTRQWNHPDTVRDRHGLACANPQDEATCPLARNCISDDLCYSDTPDFKSIDELVSNWGLQQLKIFSDQGFACNIYIPGYTGGDTYPTGFELSSTALPDGEATIPCTFNRHSISLNSGTAYLTANWPFVDDDYVQRYLVDIEWTFESTAAFAPSPPPNAAGVS